MKGKPKAVVFYLGIVIFAVGMLLQFLFPEAEGAMQSLPLVLTGFGAGIIGVGVANILRKRNIDSHPEKARQYEIAEKDERNVRLREKAGYATWYVTLFVLAILSMVLVVLNQYLACFLALGALLIHVIGWFVFMYIYSKRF